MVVDDIRRKMELQGRRGLAGFSVSLLSPGGLAVTVFRLGRVARQQRSALLAFPLKVIYLFAFYFVQVLSGISVQAYTTIGKRFVILNHGCIFIVAERIGDDFTV